MPCSFTYFNSVLQLGISSLQFQQSLYVDNNLFTEFSFKCFQVQMDLWHDFLVDTSFLKPLSVYDSKKNF